MFITEQIGSRRGKSSRWKVVEESIRVENFDNGSELAMELKIRRASALGGSAPPF